ncbi:MAG: PAS domain-containing protein [Sulfuricurvum sp.]|uniref:PAS domain-containing protein n=1 Tax=Sulfuricurvum sp. TaxID=2025608 RepID=UPI002734A181|nr:PAS domain-containing protein [Sulfuricurvum sp.]MDP2850822.1 PAS domain-containing protein [Sulfuricurvum sp.]MDP3290893.1 PAS domain-containing protein [Sulfuricurvum sp.]
MAGKEVFFLDNQFIVSKTDTSGKIIYGNELFVQISGYSESELLNQPHNILRHPDMPATVYKHLWDHIKQKEEVFAYVINRTKNQDFYWVFAHITASLDDNNKIIAYHSVRRKPDIQALDAIKPLYQALLIAERSGGIQSGEALLNTELQKRKVTYDEFVLSL